MSDVPPCRESLTSNQRARRERILDSALALLKQSDYDKIQMRDVADAADVALGTVYRYFPSKEYLFAAVLVQWSETMPSADVSIDGTNNPAGALNTVMCSILDAFGRHPQILRLFIVLDQTPDRYARELHAQLNTTTNGTFQGPLASLDPVLANDVLNVVLAVLWTVLRGWSIGDLAIDEARRQLSRSIELIFSADVALNKVAVQVESTA